MILKGKKHHDPNNTVYGTTVLYDGCSPGGVGDDVIMCMILHIVIEFQ